MSRISLVMACLLALSIGVQAEREFYLRVRANGCSGVSNKDTSSYELSRGERTLSDTIIWLEIEGFNKIAAQAEYYQENNANPKFNWITNIISGVKSGSWLKFVLTDYDYFSPPNDPMGYFTFTLPSTVNQWNTDKFGSRGTFGSSLTGRVVDGSGTCTVQLQYYAAQCNPGEYVDAIGMCQQCEAGSYCKDGVVGLQCDLGTFSKSTGAASCEPCPKGTYQAGRGRQECLPCPAGEFQDSTGKSSCKKCPAGTYGEAGNLRIDNTCDGKCKEGYYCKQGSPSETQFECGSPSVYCPKGSSNYIEAKPGMYTIGGTSATTRTNEIECEAGHRCQNGVREECEEGTFQDGVGKGKCKKCVAGCKVDEYKDSCGGDFEGTCAKCRVRSDNFDTDPNVCPDSGTVSYQACNGKGFSDNSDCATCTCDDSTADEPEYKIRQEGKCSTCKKCTYTEKNCNSGEYLVDSCKADGSTYKDSKCKTCKCEKGFFIAQCGGATSLSCEACEGAKQCGPNEFLDPSKICDGTSTSDTTLGQCISCDTVVPPPGMYMVNCKAKGDDRFRKLTECEDGVTIESVAPTKTSDRQCKLCKACNFPFEYEFWPCRNGEGDTKCRAVSEPKEGEEFVFEIATFNRDTDIRRYTDCAKQGRYFDTDELPYSGNSTSPGRDWGCLRYTMCDLENYYVQDYPTNVTNYNCSKLTDCTEFGENARSRAFQVVANQEASDRVCQLCANFNPGSRPENIVSDFNQTYADRQYSEQCAEKLVNELSAGEIAAIASSAGAAAIACLALGLVAQRKRRLAEEKKRAIEERDRAQDDLELADHMQKNPLTKAPQDGDVAELEHLLSEKNREIKKLRAEVRRLKMVNQKHEVGSFKGKDIEMAHPRKGKKQFGQQKMV